MEIEQIEGGSVTSPQGFRAGAVAGGLKRSGAIDIALIQSERDCTAAGVFTLNEVAAAPVILDRATLAANKDAMRGIAANAGNANACTGAQGMAAAQAMQQAAAEALACQPEQILVLSTGVIGVPLPVDKVGSGLQRAAGELAAENGPLAARAIMTTDTFPKHLAVRVELPGGPVTIGGIAKGSGMIHPNMATMLGVITTDAAIPSATLQAVLHEAVEVSFNAISVDGDTSTNDTVLLLANGAAGVAVEDEADRAAFAAGLTTVCTELAKLIVRDGEGATKFVELAVTGAPNGAQAKQVAATVVTSPLVKTALAGSDPNWGRFVAAAGRAGVPLNQDQIALWIGNPGGKPLQLLAAGTPTSYAEDDAAAIFAQAEIRVRLDLGLGPAETVMWTTDLSHGYVTINADYRT